MGELTQALANHFKIPEEDPQVMLPVLMETRKLGHHAGRQALGRTMNDLGFQSGIEIGTNKAESALEWCQAMPDLQLTCVDPYTPYTQIPRKRRQNNNYEVAKRKIRDSGYDIKLFRMTSREAVSRFEDGGVDFVYIDGDHRFDAVMMDLLLYAPKVRQGGVVALHDYFRINNGGVMDAVDGYTRGHAISPWYVTLDLAPTAFWQRGSEKL